MLLVLMSFEKCFAVYFPFKSKTVCTVRTAKWLTGIIGALLVSYNIVCFFFKKAEIDKVTGAMVCEIRSDFRKVYSFYFRFDSVLYSFGPFALMFLSNFAIVFKLMSAKCEATQNNLTESTNQALVKAAARGTAMVVTVSITFLILTAPAGVSDVLWPKIVIWMIPEYRVFMNITTYLNHSINGILYCIVGSRFRRELLKLFFRKGSHSNRSNSSSSSVSAQSKTLY